MGYRTVMRVPRLDSYREALKKFDNTKPIKGREPEIIPLGERRDCDSYSIRKNIWTNAIECVLYKTPVVKFKEDDEVVLTIGRWPTASTCQFISQVLRGVGANRVRGDVVLHFASGHKARLDENEELVLVRGSDGRWQPRTKKAMFDWRVDRKEANKVRKSVSQFRDYLAGIVKLKTEETTHNQGTYHEYTYSRVRATYAELIEVFGKQGNTSDQIRPDVRAWEKLDQKPKFYGGMNASDAWSEYREKTSKFYELIKDDQDDNTRHQNYWIAFNILFVQGQQLWWRDNDGYGVQCSAETFGKVLDKTLMTMFADKVFKQIELPEGKVPTGRYDAYVTTEEE